MISQLIEAKNRGREIGRVVRFTAYDFLVSTNRDTSGRAYERMAAALARLRGTSIETNIETGGQRERRDFGLIDSWRVIERDEGSDGRRRGGAAALAVPRRGFHAGADPT